MPSHKQSTGCVTQPQLGRKLLLLVSLNISILILLAVFIYSSFRHVQVVSEGVADAHMSDLVLNSQISYKLADVFSKIELLGRAFWMQDEYLVAEAEIIKNKLLHLKSGAVSHDIDNSISKLAKQFNSFVGTLHRINQVSSEMHDLDSAANSKLDKLEEVISDRLIESAVEGGDTQYTDQLLALTTSYRESLLRVGKQHAEYRFNYLHTAAEVKLEGKQIVADIDDLVLRFQTITASDMLVAAYGRSIEKLILDYRDAVVEIDVAILELNRILVDLNKTKQNLLEHIEALQSRAATEAERLTTSISTLIQTSGYYISIGVFVAIFIIAVLTIGLIRRNINTPLSQLIQGIDNLGRNHDAAITLGRNDEWETIAIALNKMQLELNSFYQKIRESEAKHRLLIENQSDLVIEVDGNGEILFTSPSFCKVFGMNDVELLGRSLLLQIHSEDRAATEEAIGGLQREPFHCNIEHRARTKYGWRWFSWNYSAVLDEDGHVVSIVGMGRDITSKNNIATELKRQRIFLHTVIDAVTHPILVIDRDYNIRMSNVAARKEYGVGENSDQIELRGLCHQVTHDSDLPCEGDEHPCPLRDVLKTGELCHATHEHLTSSGKRVFELTASPLLNEQGEIDGIVHVSRDITEKLTAEKKIRFLAHHDALTKLPNRVLLQDRFDPASSYADRAKHKVAVLYLDLDHFKHINDTLGHQIGDELLQAVVNRISANIRETNTLSRQGGDEFIILMPHVEGGNAVEIVAKHILDIMNEPLWISGHELTITVSLGISIYPDDGSDFHTLLSLADDAMYSAKKAGKNTYCFYSEDDVCDRQEV